MKFDKGLLILGVVVVALIGFKVLNPSTAPAPAVFTKAESLDAAIESGKADGKIVFIVAHADWCPPCQSLKRGALADSGVMAWLDSNAHVVGADMTKNDEPTGALGKRLSIGSIPAIIVYKDGVEADRKVGAIPAKELLSWLEEMKPGAKLMPGLTPDAVPTSSPVTNPA